MEINKKICLNNIVRNDNCDRISSLPDGVLQHILSYIDTKHAVQTCVLSRRWQYVWTNIPCLNFKYEAFPKIVANFTPEKRNSFVNLMHQVISRRTSSDIHKFSCYSGAALDIIRFRSFVDYALQHNVQILKITYSNMAIPYSTYKHKKFLDPFEMPHLVFISKSLTKLKLTAHEKGSITLPRTLSFISLKELHLGSISLWDDTTERELFSDCPYLENLTLVDCDFGKLEVLKITAPQLAKLEILIPDVLISSENCNLIVSAPKLSSFKYQSFHLLVCSMRSPLNINAVDINIMKLSKKKMSEEYHEKVARQLIAVLQEFQHAKSVTLSLRAIKILSKAPRVLDQHPSPFSNLKNFKLNLRCSSFFDGLNCLLRNSPRAKTALLESCFWFNMEDKAK